MITNIYIYIYLVYICFIFDPREHIVYMFRNGVPRGETVQKLQALKLTITEERQHIDINLHFKLNII